MSTQSLILRSAAILASGSAAARVLGLGSQVLMARWLGPEEFGLYNLSLSILALLSVFALFGFQGSLPRMMPDHAARGTGRSGAVLSTTALLALGGSILLAVGAILTRDSIIAGFFGEPRLGPCLLILAIGFPLSVAADLLQAVARAMKHSSFRVIYGDVGLPLVRTLVFLALAAIAFRPSQAAAVGVVVANAVAVAGIALGLHRRNELHFGRPSSEMAAEVLKFSWPLALSGILFVLLSRTDVYGVGFFLGVEEVGIYAVATTIAGLLNQVGLAFGYTFLPLLTEEYARDRGKAELLGRETMRWVCLATLPLVGLTIINAQPLVSILFGTRYVQAAPVISILAIGIGLNVAAGPAGNLLVASGNTVRDMLSSCIPVFLNLALNVVLIPRYGLMGAAIATSVSLAMKAVLATIFSVAATGLKLIGGRLATEISLLSVVLALGALTVRWMGSLGNAYADIARNVAIVGGAYLGSVKILLWHTSKLQLAQVSQPAEP